jgi:hypothetical protein
VISEVASVEVDPLSIAGGVPSTNFEGQNINFEPQSISFEGWNTKGGVPNNSDGPQNIIAGLPHMNDGAARMNVESQSIDREPQLMNHGVRRSDGRAYPKNSLHRRALPGKSVSLSPRSADD